jgi:glycosylphosphatidylinositol transamidase (GPIT) subunit GPI8
MMAEFGVALDTCPSKYVTTEVYSVNPVLCYDASSDAKAAYHSHSLMLIGSVAIAIQQCIVKRLDRVREPKSALPLIHRGG